MHPFNKALNYLSSKKYAKALALFKKLWAETPYKEIALNMGSAYRGLSDFDNAAKWYLNANDSSLPYTDNTFTNQYPKALNNLGLLAYTFENDEEACELYARALVIEPKYYDAIWNYSQALGRRYCSGKYNRPQLLWEMMESRFHRGELGVKLKNKKKDLIEWDYMTSVDSIVVLTEQGFGDHLQFGRYLSFLKKFAKKIWVQCAERADTFYLGYNICRDPIDTDATHAVAFCNLARLCDTIPAGDWLKDRYVQKIPNGVLDIGVTWSGNSHHGNDSYRSSKPGFFRPLSELGTLYTLNPTESGQRGFIDLDSSGWDATIRELSKLDFVVCVDTSIAHMCGSLGMKCYCIMPLYDSDYRWGDSSMGIRNVWYDSVRVIRNHGSWEEAIKDCIQLIKYENS